MNIWDYQHIFPKHFCWNFLISIEDFKNKTDKIEIVLKKTDSCGSKSPLLYWSLLLSQKNLQNNEVYCIERKPYAFLCVLPVTHRTVT